MIAGRDSRFVGGTVVLIAVVLAGGVPTAVAAGSTGVAVTPAETTAATGDQVNVDIVVDDADGGVGAWEATVNLTDGTVADIVDVRLHGNPELRTVKIADDDDSVYFDSALADTNDTGRVAIATITIAVTDSGRTPVDLRVEALGDEQGESYSITRTVDGTVGTRNSSVVTDTSTPTTATPTSDNTGVVSGDDTPTGEPDTTVPDSTPNTERPTPTAEPTSPTETRTATPSQPSDDERSTTTGAEASSTQTSVGVAAPGLTGLTSLVALLLGTVLLLRRR